MKKIKSFFKMVSAEISLLFFDVRTNYDALDYVIWILGFLVVASFIAWIIVMILGI